MDNQLDLRAVVQRLETLERRQRYWVRAAVAVAGAAMLLLAGWAPLDDLEVDLAPEPAPSVEAAPGDSTETPQPSDRSVVTPDIGSDDPVADDASEFQSYTHREGDEPYLPSRLEWICLRASAELPRGGEPADGYGIMYGPDGKGSNTVLVKCLYDSKRAKREPIEKDLEYAQFQLAALAKLQGWTWLKVRIETQAVN